LTNQSNCPTLRSSSPPTRIAPDPSVLERAADLLVEAERPVVLTDQAGDSREAVAALVELAEALEAPVFHSHRTGMPHWHNFPNTHRLALSGTGRYRDADVVLALDV